jgi:hypothetical protein
MHVSCHAHAAAFAKINFKIDEVVYGYDRKVYQFPILRRNITTLSVRFTSRQYLSILHGSIHLIIMENIACIELLKWCSMEIPSLARKKITMRYHLGKM